AVHRNRAASQLTTPGVCRNFIRPSTISPAVRTIGRRGPQGGSSSGRRITSTGVKGRLVMVKWSRSLAALCGASLLLFAGGADAADKKVSVAAISGYFAQGFGVSIVNGLNKAKDDFGINLKLIDTGNRALDYQEQFDNVAKSGDYH